MAADLSIYRLYHLKTADKAATHYLLRYTQPSYSNASQTEQDAAETLAEQRAQVLLDYAKQNYAPDESIEVSLIGELQVPPIGDALYEDYGATQLPLYYMSTKYGHPWVVLGTAENLNVFLAELKDSDDLLSLAPAEPVQAISVTFVTELDAGIVLS